MIDLTSCIDGDAVSTNGGSTFASIAGATSTTLTIPAVTAGNSGAQYQAIFTNTLGVALSNVATLLVASISSSGVYAQGSLPVITTSAGDQLGTASACTGDARVIVSTAPFASGSTGSVAVLIRRSDGTYVNSFQLTPSETGLAAGSAVAISSDGNTIFMGAPAYQNQRGAVFIFRFNGSTYVEGSPLVSAHTSAGDGSNFGWSLALSIDQSTLVVGAPGSAGLIGRTFAFVLQSGSTYTEHGSSPLVSASGAANDRAGTSVAVSSSGSVIASGASGFGGQGAVVVFQRIGASYSEATLAGGGGPLTMAGSLLLGARVAIADDGTVFATNQRPISVVAFSLAGTYSISASKGIASGTLSNPASIVVTPSGSLLLVGDIGAGGRQGAVFQYTLNTANATYSLTQTFVSAATTAGQDAQVGYSLAISQDPATSLVVAGANDYNVFNGAVFVFVLPPVIAPQPQTTTVQVYQPVTFFSGTTSAQYGIQWYVQQKL